MTRQTIVFARHLSFIRRRFMGSERSQQIEEIFLSALDHLPEQRAAYLDRVCASDPELRREVESLILTYEQGASFIERPAIEVAAKILAREPAKQLAGQAIGHYQIIEELGRGGMGEVYLAEDTRLGRRVALKLLPEHFTGDEERVRRFRQEARTASALNHPNIITIHEIDSEDGRHFIAAELIEGVTLRASLAGASTSLREALDVAVQIAEALVAAHAAGIIHRDIKPENVMVRPDGYIKVLDFGLVKLAEGQGSADKPEARTRLMVETGAGTVMGTTRYMSPEQARGLAVDARTDIWSLGVVLYEMVAGRVPFDGETPSDVIASILKTKPLPLTHGAGEVPAELQRIVMKALVKDREGRYQTSKEMASDLKGLKRKLDVETEERSRAPSSSSTRKGPSGRRRSKKAIDSLAVLPLNNMSGDPGMEYLSDGITGSIINSLSQLLKLRVMAWATVSRYKGREVNPPEVGHDLAVRAVLTGRVLYVAERLVISAELVDTADGSQIWGTQYNRPLSDIFTVQEDVAREITERLRLKLTSAERARLTKRYTENTEAYQAYLKGRFYWNKRTAEALQRGIEHFEQATRIDPDYALAYSGLADCYTLLGSAGYGTLSPEEAMAKAKETALKALRIDETLSEAHASVAFVRFRLDWDWVGAETEFRRAIELNPNYATAHHWYALYLAAMGRHDEAIAEIQRAVELDPLSLIINSAAGRVFHFARRYDQAIEHFRKTLEMDPNYSEAHFNLGMAYERKGMYDEAIAEFQKVIELSGRRPIVVASLGYTYAEAGQRVEVQRVFDELQELSKRTPITPLLLAIVHTGLGERDEALEWLEKAYRERSGLLAYLKVEPTFDSLRSDPRFEELLRRIGLTQ